MLEDHIEKASVDQRLKDRRGRIPRRMRDSKSSEVRTGSHVLRPQQGDVKKRRGQEGARATCMVSQSPAPELCTDRKLRSSYTRFPVQLLRLQRKAFKKQCES